MRALIADDDRETTEILAKTLRLWQVETTIVHDGRSAWDVIAEQRPPLAIVDWMVPDLPGVEICRRVRRDPDLAHLYVILLTDRTSREHLVAGLGAGADDYIVKPFDRDELRARVHVGFRVATLQERLASRVSELQSTRDELARLATTDALTGLCTHGRWFELAAAELARYQHARRPLALLMLDIDLFKTINDTFGHMAGDEVLRRFSEAVRGECRGGDVVGRVGGEEFAVLLPGTQAADAEEIGRRITERCRRVAVEQPAGVVRFSCSIGVAEATPSDHAIEDLMRRADAGLYRAKRTGRDRVEVQAAS